MFNVDQWPFWLTLAVFAGPGVLIAVNTAYAFYLSHRHLDDMMEALKNSKFSYTWGEALRAQGRLGSIFAVSTIAGLICFSKTAIKNGELNPTDLENFPPHIKHLLKIDLLMLLGACIWLLLVYALLKSR